MTTQQFGGEWTVEKLEILRLYLDAYTNALKNQPFSLIYIDPFAGAGEWTPRSGHETEVGSATIALKTDDKPFDRLVFIEINPENIESLHKLRAAHPHRDIRVIRGDCNFELPKLCAALGRRDRAVVFLDPFANEVNWSTVEAIARTKKIDCLILFPLMSVSRLMPADREPDPAWANTLDRVFGDREHWTNLYQSDHQPSLFGDEPQRQRERGVNQILESYRKRLESVFAGVATTPRILRNPQNNSPLFGLFFAAGNKRGAPIATRIANSILNNYRPARPLSPR